MLIRVRNIPLIIVLTVLYVLAFQEGVLVEPFNWVLPTLLLIVVVGILFDLSLIRQQLGIYHKHDRIRDNPTNEVPEKLEDFDIDESHSSVEVQPEIVRVEVKNYDEQSVVSKEARIYGDLLATKINRAREFTGTYNSDWKPIIVPLGDIVEGCPTPKMEMCLVPVGKFIMGSSSWKDEKPPHWQRITKPYWIARYPVTNAQWRVAVKAKAVGLPYDCELYNQSNMVDCPVVWVTLHQSLAFSEWAKCTIPTELETEYAVCGIENWTYSWGDDWMDGEYAVWQRNSGGKPNPVTTKTNGASWVGAMHLTGNVWEWQRSIYQDYPYMPDDGREKMSNNDDDVVDESYVLRGGSFFNPANRLRSANRYARQLSEGGNLNIGFRCALPV
jgi:formylglycine-generating enzyme required for sulfatase activity